MLLASHWEHTVHIGERQEEQRIKERIWMSLRADLLPLGAEQTGKRCIAWASI